MAAPAFSQRPANRAWTQAFKDRSVGRRRQSLSRRQQGAATYGRWGEETLRLVPRRVEVSDDNRTFRTLVEQGANCSTPAIAG